MDIMDALTTFGIPGGIGGITVFFVKKWMKSLEDGQKSNMEATSQNKSDILAVKEMALTATHKIVADAVDKFTLAIDKLENSIEIMNKNVQNMDLVVNVFKTQIDEHNKSVDRRLDTKREWLEEHETTLKEHEARINTVETTCKIHHGRRSK